MPSVYMIRCTDDSLYTGITTDLRRRMQEHYYRKGSGAKYTKSHPPQSLEMVWEADSWSCAAKLEYRIKRLTKSQKEKLILHPERVNEWETLRQEESGYVPRPELTLKMCIENMEEVEGHGPT